MADVKQSTLLEDRETVITFDYNNELVIVYTNNATVMNRFDRKGFDFYTEQRDMKTNAILARQYKLPIKEMGRVLLKQLYRV